MGKRVHDEHYCLERLEYHEKRLTQLLDAIPWGVRMVSQDEDLTRALFCSVQEELKREFKAADSSRGQAALTDAERRWYYPHLHQVSTYWQSSSTNAGLDEKLYSEVYKAHTTIFHALGELRRHLGITPEEK